jgi:sterol desaturase/sphingolipid hydroxylase (fatty acid hydroxylase superfamily)
MLESGVVVAAGEIVNELPFPPIVFGGVFLVGFIALALVTYSYRNVSNRHRTKSIPDSHQGHH